MQYAGILISLSLYAALCFAIARIYVRTGHSSLWSFLSFLPFLFVLLSYGLDMTGISPQIGRGILPLIVLVYLALLLTLALKRWPKASS